MFKAAAVASGLLLNRKKFFPTARCADGAGDGQNRVHLFEQVEDNYEINRDQFQRNKSEWDEYWNLSFEDHGYTRLFFITPPEFNQFNQMTPRGNRQSTLLLTEMINNIIDVYVLSHNFKFFISDDYRCQQFKNSSLFKDFYGKLTNFMMGIRTQQGLRPRELLPNMYPSPRLFVQDLNNAFLPNMRPVSRIQPGTVVEDSEYGKPHMEHGFGDIFYLCCQPKRGGSEDNWCEIYICPKNYVNFVITRLMQMNINHNYGRFDIGDASITEIRINKKNHPYIQSIGERGYLHTGYDTM